MTQQKKKRGRPFGFVVSPETRRKLSKAHKGRKPAHGHSYEVRQKLAEAMRRRWAASREAASREATSREATSREAKSNNNTRNTNKR